MRPLPSSAADTSDRAGLPLGHLFKRPFTDNLWNCKNRLRERSDSRNAGETPENRPPRPFARLRARFHRTTRAPDPRRNAAPPAAKEEHASGADRTRPVLARLLRKIRAGETLVVVRLDRLARSVSHLLAVIEQLEASGAHFRSLHDPIDTSTPQGMFSLQVLGAVAQLERALIAERTKAGLKAARSRGRIGGNPGLRAGDADAIRKVRASRAAAHLDGVLEQLDSWLPTVRRMRPDQPWGDVARVLNRGNGATWTVERLRRTRPSDW